MKRLELDDKTDSFFKPREWDQAEVNQEIALDKNNVSDKYWTSIVNRDKSRMRSIKQKVRNLFSITRAARALVISEEWNRKLSKIILLYKQK